MTEVLRPFAIATLVLIEVGSGNGRGRDGPLPMSRLREQLPSAER